MHKARTYKKTLKGQARSNYDRKDAYAEAGKLLDGLGYRMDRRIIPLVASLRALGFETTGSCEGHIDHGEAAPWVDIGEQPPRAILVRLFAKPVQERQNVANEPVLRSLRKRNLRAQLQLLALLDDFYARRNIPATYRLLLQRSGIYGAFRLTFQGANVQPALSRAEQSARLSHYQLEASRFTRLLETKYLRGRHLRLGNPIEQSPTGELAAQSDNPLND